MHFIKEIITHLKICVSTHFASVPKLFGQLLVKSITSLFAQGGFYLPLCKAQLNLLGSSGFCFTQNIGIDFCGDVHITVTKMFGHNFQVDTAVQEHCGIAVSELMQCHILDPRSIGRIDIESTADIFLFDEKSHKDISCPYGLDYFAFFLRVFLTTFLSLSQVSCGNSVINLIACE